MVKYHWFKTKDEGEAFLADLRKNGGLGYSLGMCCGEYEVREIV